MTPNQGGAINWPSPSFDPETGLFYANAARAWSVYYLYDAGDKPEGWGGNDRSGYSEAMLASHRLQNRANALEPPVARQRRRRAVGFAEHCREIAVRRRSKFQFRGARSCNGHASLARDIAAGVTNGPITYELDGVQYVVAPAGDTLYGFAMRGH